MSSFYFPAIVERDESDGYSVFFPDLPGCVSAGDTVQEVARGAEDALRLHLVGMVEEGLVIPAPSEIDAIKVDADVREVARLLVAGDIPGRKVRINVMMDERLLSFIDRYEPNRSRFLDLAARSALAGRVPALLSAN